MKKSDDTFPDKGDGALNVNRKSVDEGDVMQTQVSLKNSDDRKVEDNVTNSMSEKRSVNSDRRISDGHNYLGPARRMNLDRRK